jgi:hypothetical protein
MVCLLLLEYDDQSASVTLLLLLLILKPTQSIGFELLRQPRHFVKTAAAPVNRGDREKIVV